MKELKMFGEFLSDFGNFVVSIFFGDMMSKERHKDRGLLFAVWVEFLSFVMFGLFDSLRMITHSNLGRFPMFVKLLYIRLLVDSYGYSFGDAKAMQESLAANRAQKRDAYFKLSKRERLAGNFAMPAMAGGARTIVTGAGSGLFFKQNPGGLPSIVDFKLFTGNVFFVDATTAQGGTTSGYGDHPDRAITSINAAIALCTANQNDCMFVLPGHTESTVSVGAIASSIAGVSVIGLGQGAQRATVTWATLASATWAISAASCLIANIRCTATVAATKLFTVTAANVTFDKVDYVEGSAIPLQFILTTNAADQLEVRNCYHVAVTAGASAQIWIECVGTDDWYVHDNVFFLTLNNASGTYTLRASTAAVRAVIARNTCVQLGGTTQTAVISLAASSTGIVVDNRVGANVTNIAGTIALASAYGYGNFITRTVNKSGILDPVVDS